VPPMPSIIPSDRKLTYADYLQIPEDGLRHEIVDGDHYVSPSPLRRHQRVSLKLTLAIGPFLEETGCGELYEAPCDVRLGEHTVLEPDLLVVLADHFDRQDRRGVAGPPDLVIEILSESSRSYDQVVKRRIYAREGVAEYWVVDPDAERVELYRRGPGTGADDYDRPLVFSADRRDTLGANLLPGLAISLDVIFDPGPAARIQRAREDAASPGEVEE